MKLERLEKINRVLEEMVEKKFVSGVSCLVLKDGVEQCYFDCGVIDIENGTPIQRNSIFRIYSMTKVVTSVAVMMLMEEGKIDLLEPISKYLGGFKKQHLVVNGIRREPIHEVTIKDLLNMTSGVTYPGNSCVAEVEAAELMERIKAQLLSENAMKTVQIANEMGEHALAFEPGSNWQYGFSADILGALVEVVSGMKYSDFLKQKIFSPLEMIDTDFFVEPSKQSRLAKVYQQCGNDLILYKESHLGVQNEMKLAPAFESGGAGLASTIDDCKKFYQMLLNMGEYNQKRLLSEATVKYMTGGCLTKEQQKGLNWDNLAGYSYSNLLRIMKRPDLAVTCSNRGEYGWDGWLGTYAMNDPDNKLSVLLMQQRVDSGTTEYTRRIKNIVYTSL